MYDTGLAQSARHSAQSHYSNAFAAQDCSSHDIMHWCQHRRVTGAHRTRSTTAGCLQGSKQASVGSCDIAANVCTYAGQNASNASHVGPTCNCPPPRASRKPPSSSRTRKKKAPPVDATVSFRQTAAMNRNMAMPCIAMAHMGQGTSRCLLDRTCLKWRIQSVSLHDSMPGTQANPWQPTMECTTNRMRTNVKKREASGASPTG